MTALRSSVAAKVRAKSVFEMRTCLTLRGKGLMAVLPG